ncbi:MAG: hypothetical protein K9N06_05070 [Candidatus Cloacimonetes bacterium]|nr:hypothetical protein [Candidatus Cloacimonadota bacterium]
MQKYLNAIIIILILVIGFSCTSENKSEVDKRNMLFNFDSTRVEKAVLLGDSGIQVNPPKGMVDFTAQINDKSPILSQLPFNVAKENCSLYFNQENNSVMITSYSPVPLEVRQLEITGNMPLQLNSKDSFIKDGISFYQYVYSDTKNVMLVILIPDHNIVFDIIYMIPRESYNEYSRNIESSLGSVIKKEVKKV